VCILRESQSLWRHDEAIADRRLGGCSLRWTASTRPLFGRADRFHTIVERMRAPGTRRAAPPSLPPAFIVTDGRRRVRRTGKPSGCHALDVLGDTRGLFGWRRDGGPSCVLGSRAGVHNEKPEFFHRETPVSVFYCHRTDDTGPMPASRSLLARPTRFFQQEGQWAVLLAPHL